MSTPPHGTPPRPEPSVPGPPDDAAPQSGSTPYSGDVRPLGTEAGVVAGAQGRPAATGPVPLAGYSAQIHGAGAYPYPPPTPNPGQPQPPYPGHALYPAQPPYPGQAPYPGQPYSGQPQPSYPGRPQPYAPTPYPVPPPPRVQNVSPPGRSGRHDVHSRQPRTLPRWAQIVLDVVLLVVCGFFSLGTAAVQSGGMGEVWLLLFFFASIAAPITILFRRSRPVMATVAAACATLVLPIDNLAVLICLPWVIATRPSRTAWRVGALAVLAALVALVRDGLLGPEHSIFFLADRITEERDSWPVLGYLAIAMFLLTVSIGSGLLRRSRSTVAQAHTEQQQLRAELTTELSRQDERDLIARELHDTVAHHLSVVSLRASALEVSGDDSVQEAAQSVRSSTHQALEEMRDLIGVLRNGQASLTAGPGPGRTLTELPELIATARESGADVAASVFVTGGETAPTPLTRAVYRIVQESLTNAIKHAPQQRIDLELRAAPGTGVHLRVSNPLPGVPVDAPGSGSGLLGIRERVASVGGRVEAGAQGGRWVLTAHLPWPATD